MYPTVRAAPLRSLPNPSLSRQRPLVPMPICGQRSQSAIRHPGPFDWRFCRHRYLRRSGLAVWNILLGAHTFAFPRLSANPWPIKKLLLVLPRSAWLPSTGTKNVAILEVKRADGRDPTKLEGAPPPPPADGQNPYYFTSSIVSVPSTRTVARGGTTTLFVSASEKTSLINGRRN